MDLPKRGGSKPEYLEKTPHSQPNSCVMYDIKRLELAVQHLLSWTAVAVNHTELLLAVHCEGSVCDQPEYPAGPCMVVK